MLLVRGLTVHCAPHGKNAASGTASMPSPFLGMDPFLENQKWEDFYGRFNTVISEQLSPVVRPNHFNRIERRDYVEHVVPEPDPFRWTHVAVEA